MKSRVRVAALVVPVVLTACDRRGSCTDFDPGPEDRTDEFFVAGGDLDAALDTGGELSEEECARLCIESVTGFSDITVNDCTLSERTVTDLPDDGGRISCSYTALAACRGRLHVGIRSRSRPQSGTGAWFAAAAHDEAAAVKAFHALALELSRLGAPDDLVVRAKAAARDEVGHARMMTSLARMHGVEPVAPTFRQVPERDLCGIGIENASEGCVRETFAALLAHHQARRARPQFRPAFSRLAQDETRHAQWSWDLDAWLRTVLSARDVRRLQQAQERALASLDVGGSGPRGLGLPSRNAAGQMADRFSAAVRTYD